MWFSFHILSLRYCDILHRSALHLGVWEKIETGRTMLLVNNTWKDDILWPYGTLVRLGRDIWRAQGDCNASEPGNLGQKRFYVSIYMILLMDSNLQFLIVNTFAANFRAVTWGACTGRPIYN